MISLFPCPLVIKGKPITRTNRTIDYRLKNMHPSEIRNPRMAAAKRLWDESNCYRDVVMWTTKAFCRTHRVCPVPKGRGVQLEITIYFKAKNPNAAECRNDADNCLKLLQDALAKAGVFPDDKQVTDLILRKRVSWDDPRVVIHQVSVLD